LKSKIDISAEQYSVVKSILAQYVSANMRVWVFGSRVKLMSKPYSDLDIALEMLDKSSVPQEIVNQLEYAFEESDLPWKVDIVDLNSISAVFRDIINKDKILFEGL
jgi:predicted nucleotidyltransferase